MSERRKACLLGEFTHRINILDAERARDDRLEKHNSAETWVWNSSKVPKAEYLEKWAFI